MECMHCKAQWTLREGQTKLANCPFCGKTLMIEEIRENYTDLAEALRAIAKMRGVECLTRNPLKVLGIFLDITQNLQKEYRLLKLFYDNGTEKFFADIGKITEGQLNMASRSLQENVFMGEESARHIVNIFADVLGVKDQVPEPEDRILSGGQSVSQKSVMKVTFRKEGKDISFQEERKAAPLPKEMVAAENFKAGMTIELYQDVYQIIEAPHVRPGKNAAFVRAKLMNIRSGDLMDKTFHPAETFLVAKIEKMKMQYVYSIGNSHTFMYIGPETCAFLDLDNEIVGNALKFVKENEMVTVYFYNGWAFLVEPPLFVERKITNSAPGFKGDISPSEEMIEAKNLKEGDYIELKQVPYRVVKCLLELDRDKKEHLWIYFLRYGNTRPFSVEPYPTSGVGSEYFLAEEKCIKAQMESLEIMTMKYSSAAKQYLASETCHSIMVMVKLSDITYTYDLNHEIAAKALRFSLPNDTVSVHLYKKNALYLELPSSVSRKVMDITGEGNSYIVESDCEESPSISQKITGIRNQHKKICKSNRVILENGEEVEVPASVKKGDIVEIETCSRGYAKPWI